MPRKTTQNTKEFLPPLNPRKPLEKQRKTAENTQNTKEFPCLEKTKENQNTKEKKIRACVPQGCFFVEDMHTHELGGRQMDTQLGPPVFFLFGSILHKQKKKVRRTQVGHRVLSLRDVSLLKTGTLTKLEGAKWAPNWIPFFFYSPETKEKIRRTQVGHHVSLRDVSFKVPEGHHPRGTTLREALRGNLPLRGLCGGLSEGSAGSLRGFCGVSAGFRGIFRGFRG